MDMIVTDESPSQISDKIKDILFSKSAERIDTFKPVVSSSLFGDEVENSDYDEDSDYEQDSEEY